VQCREKKGSLAQWIAKLDTNLADAGMDGKKGPDKYEKVSKSDTTYVCHANRHT
jgi:hypothetical protein